MRHFLPVSLNSRYLLYISPLFWIRFLHVRQDRMAAGTILKWWTVIRNKGILQLVAEKVGAGNPPHLVGYIGSTVC
jgi:hypothetical protein